MYINNYHNYFKLIQFIQMKGVYTMFNKNKILVFITLLCFILTIGVTSFASTNDNMFNTEIDNKHSLECFNVNSLNDYSDVKEYISNKGYNNITKKFASKTDKLVDKKTELDIAQRYGLVNPNNDDLDSDTFVLVDRKIVDGNYAIESVWYFRFYTKDTYFQIQVLNVGSDSLDVVSGTTKLYKLNRDTWNYATQRSFTKYNAYSGAVDTWYISKDAVKEKFEYNITVTEDGQKWYYNNIGVNNKTRYNFVAGAYSTMTANGGDRHHFVSSNALGSAGFNTNTAPAIRMMYRDHLNTPSWGSSSSAIAYRAQELSLLNAGKYEELLQMEVDGFYAEADSEGIYSSLASKYYDEMIDVLYLLENYFGI